MVSLALWASHTKSATWRLPKDPDRLAEGKGNEMYVSKSSKSFRTGRCDLGENNFLNFSRNETNPQKVS